MHKNFETCCDLSTNAAKFGRLFSAELSPYVLPKYAGLNYYVFLANRKELHVDLAVSSEFLSQETGITERNGRAFEVLFLTDRVSGLTGACVWRGKL
jgi:hypothetical protein